MKSTSLRQYGYVPGGETCATTGKKRWLSRRDAKKVARRINPGEHMSAYRCDSCGGFHLGHMPAEISMGIYSRGDLQPRTDA